MSGSTPRAAARLAEPVGLALRRPGADAGPVTEPSKYAMTLDELVASARVLPEEQVSAEDDVRDRIRHDESAGHLPGNVRPYGA